MADPIKFKVRRAGWVIDIASGPHGEEQTVSCDGGAYTKEEAKAEAKKVAKKMGGAIIEIETVRAGFIETITLEPMVDNGPELPFKEDGRGDLKTEPEAKEDEPQSAKSKFGFGGSKWA